MDVLIIGAGGHGKVVLEILRAAGVHKPIGFVDADTALAGTTVGGLPVLGPPNLLPKLRKTVRGAIVAIGDNRTRLQSAELLREHQFELVNAIHPTASVSPTATLGENIVVAAQAAIGTEAKVGHSTIINTAAVVDHECVIGIAAHICPGAHLAGRVQIGGGAFVGTGANVIPCMSIGAHAIIGSGAVVIADIPANTTAVGTPARVIKSRDK